jgi:hypothetical protein
VKLGARLVGLGLIGLGLGSLGIVYLLWLLDELLAPRIPVPPGLPAGFVPRLSPLTCMIPVMGIASALLVLEGLRRLLAPD